MSKGLSGSTDVCQALAVWGGDKLDISAKELWNMGHSEKVGNEHGAKRKEEERTRSPAVTPAPVPPDAAMASTAVKPTVSTTDWPAFRVADTRSVATDAFCTHANMLADLFMLLWMTVNCATSLDHVAMLSTDYSGKTQLIIKSWMHFQYYD